MKNIRLFISGFCPFCEKVIDYIEENNMDIEIIDVNENVRNKTELLEIGGKDQIPMLDIDGKALYESGEIMYWLENNYK